MTSDNRALELADYRRRVASLYSRIRERGAGAQAHQSFRELRDEIFATHPQSPLSAAQREAFAGLDYYPYDPRLRFTPRMDANVPHELLSVTLRDDGDAVLERVGRVRIGLQGREFSLSLFWLRGYGGGLFLPFRDGSNGSETYGGGRYLLDTVKGADLGQDEGRIILDFNYSYNPSCAYSATWDCPLAPPENWLDVPIRAGEKTFRER
jgi:uncharacterized protein (DUF1684 family)